MPEPLRLTAPEIPAPELADHAALVEAWRQAHYAAQAAAEVGKSWGVPRDDDSHSSFEWLPELGALAGEMVAGVSPCRAALRLADLTLLLLDRRNEPLAEMTLDGPTLEEATAWVRRHAERLTGQKARQKAIPAPDLPEHPLADNAAFGGTAEEARRDLSRLYGLAHAVLTRVQRALPDAEPVRTWPHHFDIATLVILERDDKGEMSRTVGFGLTPPDSFEPSGYWYVSAWPTPNNAAERAEQAPLPIGRWEADGRLMAVLSLSDFAGVLGGDAARREAVASFLAAAHASLVEADRG